MKKIYRMLVLSFSCMLISINAQAALITFEGLWVGQQGLNATSTMVVDTSLATAEGMDTNGSCGPCVTDNVPAWVSDFTLTIGTNTFVQTDFNTIFLDLDTSFTLDYMSELVAQNAAIDFNFFASGGNPDGVAVNQFVYQGVNFDLVSLTPVSTPSIAMLISLGMLLVCLRKKLKIN